MMLIIAILLLTLCLPFTEVLAKTVRVKSTFTKTGTYRPTHVRTSPNKTKIDNWSTKGNVNPYTGKQGTKDAY